jgi:hypothetical protein
VRDEPVWASWVKPPGVSESEPPLRLEPDDVAAAVPRLRFRVALPVVPADAVALVRGVARVVGALLGVAAAVVAAAGLLAEQSGVVKVLLSRVTEPVRASARPSTTVFVVTVIDAIAMIVPRNVEAVPNVAELPTCQ